VVSGAALCYCVLVCVDAESNAWSLLESVVVKGLTHTMHFLLLTFIRILLRGSLGVLSILGTCHGQGSF
jgi:hypothetical protein